jgi:ABC-type Zn2+ transport system substrate-binding protein/surface adhesin
MSNRRNPDAPSDDDPLVRSLHDWLDPANFPAIASKVDAKLEYLDTADRARFTRLVAETLERVRARKTKDLGRSESSAAE